MSSYPSLVSVLISFVKSCKSFYGATILMMYVISVQLRSSATFIELQSETSDYPTVGSGTIAPVLITEKGPPPPLHIPPGGSSPLTPMNVQADKGKSQKGE